MLAGTRAKVRPATRTVFRVHGSVHTWNPPVAGTPKNDAQDWWITSIEACASMWWAGGRKWGAATSCLRALVSRAEYPERLAASSCPWTDC